MSRFIPLIVILLLLLALAALYGPGQLNAYHLRKATRALLEDVAWRLDEGASVVVVHDDAGNAFNKTVVPLAPGRYALCATSHGVEGCQYAEVLPDPRR